jgi:hypothetical protein
MSCRKKLNRNTGKDLDVALISERLKLCERCERIALCVERKRGLML